jgi:hypothetical protein
MLEEKFVKLEVFYYWIIFIVDLLKILGMLNAGRL